MLFIDLQTEKLLLKNIENADRDFVFKEFSNKNDDINKYLYDAEPLTDISGADEIINFYLKSEPRNQHRWVIIRKTDNTKIGTCGFHAWDRINSKVEIGYELLREYWGNGYMHEAIVEIIKFSKEIMQIKEITADIYVENIKSINLAEKIGFELTGTKNYFFRGKNYLHKVYTLHTNNKNNKI
jgi:ribosomal-protein-alanine N-acetyltransferase